MNRPVIGRLGYPCHWRVWALHSKEAAGRSESSVDDGAVEFARAASSLILFFGHVIIPSETPP